jgi:hypothetical protein
LAKIKGRREMSDIKEQLLSKKVEFFHTPETFSAIEDWIEAHASGEQAHLATAAMMAWNYALEFAAKMIEAEQGEEE